MVVIAIIGILAAVLFPSLTSYEQRSRDVVRITSIDLIHKSMATYFLDEDRYPNPIAWCVPDAVVMKYNAWQASHDKVFWHDNGCGPNANFWYGTGLNIPYSGAGGDEYIILARLEFPNTGNFSDAFIAQGGYTGTLTATGFGNAYTKRIKGSGNWYIALK